MAHTTSQTKWALEAFAYTCIESLTRFLPGPLVFRFGEALGALTWHLMPKRRAIVLRNLRIALHGQASPEEIHTLAKANFRRTGANLISSSHTAMLSPAQLSDAIEVENIQLLNESYASGKGTLLLLSHMGNWEILARLCHFFPAGSKAGAFYRPLNNLILDERVLRRREKDGTRMFSKRDSPHHVAGFLREGGIVGILADQRVGRQGELTTFFGRTTRSSPLPSLLARRTKSNVLALSLTTTAPGKWKATFHPVPSPPTTSHCMQALETAMRSSLVDVFWMQERWKAYLGPAITPAQWLTDSPPPSTVPHRALVWLVGSPSTWEIPTEWQHPDIPYEVALTPGQPTPPWASENTIVHRVSSVEELTAIDSAAALPFDFVLTPEPQPALAKFAKSVAIPVISLP